HAQSHRFLELLAQRTVVEARLLSLGAEEREAFEQVQAREVEIAQQREALEADQSQIEALAARAHALSSQVKLDQQNLEHWRADEGKTRARIDAAAKEIEEIRAAIELATAQEAEHRLKSEALSVEGKEDEVALSVVV